MNFEVIEIFKTYLLFPLSRTGWDYSSSGHCTCKGRHLPFIPSSGKPTPLCLMRALVTSGYWCVAPSVITGFIPVGPSTVLPPFIPAGTCKVNLLLRWLQQFRSCYRGQGNEIGERFSFEMMWLRGLFLGGFPHLCPFCVGCSRVGGRDSSPGVICQMQSVPCSLKIKSCPYSCHLGMAVSWLNGARRELQPIPRVSVLGGQPHQLCCSITLPHTPRACWV